MPRAKRTAARIVAYYRKRGESDEYIRTLITAIRDYNHDKASAMEAALEEK